MTQEEEAQFNQLAILAGQVFKPNTPISGAELFSGRISQIRRVLDVIFQQGQHAIIFGERGVGKTSLANVFSSFIPAENSKHNLLSTRINCDLKDTFTSVWRKVVEEMQLTGETKSIGFKPNTEQKSFGVNDFFPNDTIRPDEVRRALTQLSNNFLPVIVIDEFDRLKEDVRKIFADLIKTLSDYESVATIILIGVGENVTQLINDHQSVSRAMAQVQMPRMGVLEIREIINSRMSRLKMTIDEDAISRISLLSMGLPHYCHLIGLHATRDALDNNSMTIKESNILAAIKKAIEDSQHTIKTNYLKAIRSLKKDNLFTDVLLSCALAETNELGEFSGQDVRTQMPRVTGKQYEIPAFAQHLKEFSEIKRGKVLIKSGEKRLYRYKFADPLMQPYIIMKGFLDNKITLN
jgi:energy-coupling factor transporter ATP-binding protein EcfA2